MKWFQINAFMVLAIIGCVVSAIQVIVAADGAATVKHQYSSYFEFCGRYSYDTDYCADVSRFTRYKELHVLYTVTGLYCKR